MPDRPASFPKIPRVPSLLAISLVLSAGATGILAACNDGTTSGPLSSESPDNTVPGVGVPSTHSTLPTTRITIPGTTINVPGTRIVIPGTVIRTPLSTITVPGTTIVVPATRITVPGTRLTIPTTGIATPTSRIVVPATRIKVPGTTIRTPLTVIRVPGTTIVVPGTTIKVPTTRLGLKSASMAVSTSPIPGSVRFYNLTTKSAATGDTVGFTVFEPAGLTAGQTYPLVLYGNGFGKSRTQTLHPARPGIVDQLVATGYGVITISPQGQDDSTGALRTMDPLIESQDGLAVLDWAEANLPWLKIRPGAVGGRPSPVVAAAGDSFNNTTQLIMNDGDPRHRLATPR